MPHAPKEHPSQRHPANERAAVNILEFSADYGWSRATTYRLAKCGRLKLTKIGARSIILAEHRAEFHATLTKTAGEK